MRLDALGLLCSGLAGHLVTIYFILKEEFGTLLIFNDFSLNASENFSKQISKTFSAAEHFSSRYNTSAVLGPDDQAISSSTAVPRPHGQVAAKADILKVS